MSFDPAAVAVANGNYFGMPFTPDDAALVLLSVPWDVTSSYGSGAARAPEAIIEASTQLDFFDPVSPQAWRRGIATLPIDTSIEQESRRLRPLAAGVMRALENGAEPDPHAQAAVNTATILLNNCVRARAKEWLDRGKIVGLVGGDHGTPQGLIEELGARHPLSVLHIDAHADLREGGYEGFRHSHASIMWNILPHVERLVQVGVRDQSDPEALLAFEDPRIVQFDDWTLAAAAFTGTTWDAQCTRIVGELGQAVYVSFDIDGLRPELAPGTGTPVPGGLSFDKAVWLLSRVVESGRSIVGFDLCEVAPTAGQWDANVGARMLFKLCGLSLKK